jgi:thioredoxin 1
LINIGTATNSVEPRANTELFFKFKKANTLVNLYSFQGITCNGCKNSVTEIYSKIEGVKNVNMSSDFKEILIVSDEEISIDVLREGIAYDKDYKLKTTSLKTQVARKLATKKTKLTKLTKHMNDKFQNLINSEVPVLLDFYADWCGPCQAMKPILVDLKERMGDKAMIVKIDTEKNQDLSSYLQIRSIPTLMIYKKGEQVWRHSGVVDANQLEEILNSLK